MLWLLVVSVLFAWTSSLSRCCSVVVCYCCLLLLLLYHAVVLGCCCTGLLLYRAIAVPGCCCCGCYCLLHLLLCYYTVFYILLSITVFFFYTCFFCCWWEVLTSWLLLAYFYLFVLYYSVSVCITQYQHVWHCVITSCVSFDDVTWVLCEGNVFVFFILRKPYFPPLSLGVTCVFLVLPRFWAVLCMPRISHLSTSIVWILSSSPL